MAEERGSSRGRMTDKVEGTGENSRTGFLRTTIMKMSKECTERSQDRVRNNRHEFDDIVPLTHDMNEPEDFQFHGCSLSCSVRPANITFLLLHGSVVVTMIVARLCVVVTRPARRVSSHVALPARVLSPSRVQCVFASSAMFPLAPKWTTTTTITTTTTTSPYIIATSRTVDEQSCPRRLDEGPSGGSDGVVRGERCEQPPVRCVRGLRSPALLTMLPRSLAFRAESISLQNDVEERRECECARKRSATDLSPLFLLARRRRLSPPPNQPTRGEDGRGGRAIAKREDIVCVCR